MLPEFLVKEHVHPTENVSHSEPAQESTEEPTATTATATPEPEIPTSFTTPSYATPATNKVLQRQLRQVIKLQTQTTAGKERYWTLDTSKLDNLYAWQFTLHTFDRDILLSQDLVQYGLEGVCVEFQFPPNYPNTPPLVRVVRPRFVQWMYGGGGHVTAGGSICIAILTMDSWQKDISVDHVLMVVHTALSDMDPVPARIHSNREYGIHEAAAAYERVAQQHGWPTALNWYRLFTMGTY